MKTQKQPSASKLAKRFDNELKDLLMADLKTFKLNHPFFSNNKQELERELSAA